MYLQTGEGNGTPLQYSCLENPRDGGAWWAAVHGVAKTLTWLSDLTFIFHFHALEKEMATHSRVLAWRIPGTGEPGELPSMWSHRVGHDWNDLAAAAAAFANRSIFFSVRSVGLYTSFLLRHNILRFHTVIKWLCGISFIGTTLMTFLRCLVLRKEQEVKYLLFCAAHKIE